jgi:CDP-diacylglycerol--glycerol-3-phosphate 3-phosphatidyltransferase
VGARLTAPAVPSCPEYLDRWSRLHGNAAPTGLVGWWLRFAYRVAVPLVRLRVGPDAVTVLGLLVAVAALLPASAGGRWPLIAVLLVVASGVLDSLDGAVAVLTARATRWGFVLDSLCDRISDAAYAAALALAGGPWALATGGAALAWLHEYARARAAVAGMPGIGVVTVSERPTRVIVTAMFLLGAGLYPSAAQSWATAGTAAWATLGVVGLVQLLVVIRRRLRTDVAPIPEQHDQGG